MYHLALNSSDITINEVFCSLYYLPPTVLLPTTHLPKRNTPQKAAN